MLKVTNINTHVNLILKVRKFNNHVNLISSSLNQKKNSVQCMNTV